MRVGGRLDHIDSLRAVAALLVVWTHSAELFAPGAGVSWWQDIAQTFDFGRMGVVAFFGLSGFLIPKALDTGRADAGRAFVIRRLFRLVPAFWLSIPLGVLAVWALFQRPIAPGDVALNFTMIPDAFGAQPVMGLYWTLEYELAFYVAVLALFKARVLQRPGAMATCTALLLAASVFGYAATPLIHRQEAADLGLVALNMGLLFLGALWRQFLDGELKPGERVVLVGALGLIWLAIPAACAWAIHVHGSANPFFIRFPVAYAGGLALFIAMTSAVRVHWRPLAWVGMISYSVYLLHPVVIYALRYAFDHRSAGAGWPVGFQMLAAAILSITVAAVAFYAVERPAIALGRRLTAAT
ncbi:MAG: acyltransferase [Phenylobacterium sp.]